MSEEHSTDETEDVERTSSVNRRRFVKSLGVAGGIATVGGMGSARGSAKSTENPTIETVEDSSANKAIKKSRDSRKYKILVEYLQNEENLLVDNSDIEVYTRKETDNSGDRVVVSFPTTSTTDQKYIRSGIAVTLRRERIQKVVATSTREISDEVLEVTHYELSDGKVQKEAASLKTSDMTVEMDGTTTDVSKLAQDQVTTQGVKCDACTAFGDAVCTIGGCGAPLAVICGVAASTLGGGVACSVVASSFCAAAAFINEHTQGYTCQSDYYIELTCERASFC